MTKKAPRTTYESHSRSLLKGLSWRIFGSCFTALIAFLLTESISLTLYISFIEFFAKIILFYCHERLWHFIPFGTSKFSKDLQ